MVVSLWAKEMEQIKVDFGVFLLGGMIQMGSAKSPPVGSVLGGVVCFTWTFALFFFPRVHFQPSTYPKQPLETKGSFKTEELRRNFKFKPQFHLWAQTVLSQEVLWQRRQLNFLFLESSLSYPLIP